MTLTEKQKRFCDEYLIDLNATQAAIRAGYSGKNARNIASENLAKPNIKKYIEDRMAQKATKLIADQDEVLKYLTGVMRNEESEEVVIVEGTGDGCSEARVIKKDASIKDRVKAAELLGKRYSLFTDKVDLNADMDLKITVDYGEDEND
ncbi:terminase small subunit [Eubacterium callanderi]|uniref:Terminase small subunit n=1 Tax=Eubacterium callanderi TaxID=53442 RepID=A0A853JR40_9FIRM|nr:terminase small subunit [Eubacterium callanderi]